MARWVVRALIAQDLGVWPPVARELWTERLVLWLQAATGNPALVGRWQDCVVLAHELLGPVVIRDCSINVVDDHTRHFRTNG